MILLNFLSTLICLFELYMCESEAQVTAGLCSKYRGTWFEQVASVTVSGVDCWFLWVDNWSICGCSTYQHSEECLSGQRYWAY